MGLFDRGGREPAPGPATKTAAPTSDDDRAIERYRYLLRTAPPDTIEAAHAEAFSRLTAGQRRSVLDEIAATMPEHERERAADAVASPGDLARYATRAEIRRPGTIERALAAAPAAGSGPAWIVAGALAGSVAGTVLGSVVAQRFFAHDPTANAPFGDDTRGFGTDAGSGTDRDELVAADDPDAGFDDGGFDGGFFDA